MSSREAQIRGHFGKCVLTPDLPPKHSEGRRQEGEAARHAHCHQARRQSSLGPRGVPGLDVRDHRAVVIAAPRGIAEGPSRGLTRGSARASSPLVPVSAILVTIHRHAAPRVMVLRVLHADRTRATMPDVAASLRLIHCSTACCWQVADHLAGLPPRGAPPAPGGAHRGAAACAHRRGQPRGVSVRDSRRSCAVSPAEIPIGSEQVSEACHHPARTPRAPLGAVACTAPTPCGIFPWKLLL